MQSGGTSAPVSVIDQAWQYGVLGIAALVLAVVIIKLYARLNQKDDAFAAERKAIQDERIKQDAAHELEIEKLRGDYEARLRANAEDHTEAIRAEMKQSRDREDMIRREFADLMETIATKAAEASDATRQVLDKIYERFLGPRR